MRATDSMIPVIALSGVPREGRDADRFARWVRGYADIFRTRGLVITSTHWNSSNDASRVIIDVGDRSEASPEAFSLAERTVSLLQGAGLSAEFGHSSPGENANWNAIQNEHEDASFPLIHVSVPARFGSDLMALTGRALEPLRREGVLLVGLSAAFGEGIRRDGIHNHRFGAAIIEGVPV